MSQTQAMNELKYKMIESCLKKLVGRGLLTEWEFEVANGHNAEKYRQISPSFSR